MHPRPGHTPGARPALQRQPTAEERRRAQRVLLRMPVVAHIKDKAPMSGTTHSVSATGAMIVLPEGLAAGTKFTLENPKTQQKVEVNVVRPSQLNQDGSLVPVEFVTPAPNFWNIFFPPNLN
jgi:c-di-GMP-binding flagellar brake protein YcgR